MPAQRARASFEPIPPNFDVRALVENTENFQYVDRISCEMIQEQGIDKFEKLVLLHVVVGGKPLVVDGFETKLDPWTFTPGWLRDNHGSKVEQARDLTTKQNIPLTIKHYLEHMPKLTDQFFENPKNFADKNRQRVYLKDIDCPPVWADKLQEQIPAALFYWNDSTGEIGGAGAVDEALPNAPGRRRGKGIARAGDLMSSLPAEMRADNLMCYIGHEGTYTPAHREMCASLGQNIMVEASGTVGEGGKPEKPGSSIWFMTETKDRHLVAEYWLSVLGHDIEIENHFAQLIAWKKAPFKTYVVEQRPGDFILIPPLAPHQVWNRGSRTMKVAWNRTTVETLEMAINEALPNSRIVCRDEQYKNKAIIYYTLQKYSSLLKQAKAMIEHGGYDGARVQSSTKVRQLRKDFKRLFALFKDILLSETFNPDGPKEHPEYLQFDSNVTCAYCRGNIFNRFLTCKTCTGALGGEIEEPYDVCMDCYAMGRSCGCLSDLKWVEQWKWRDLNKQYEEWRKQVIEFEGGVITPESPLPLSEERARMVKNSLAAVCQQQLKLRPWVDIKNPNIPDEDENSEEEIVVNDDGTVKKSKKKKSEAYLKNHKSCHVCLKRHPLWKMAVCTNCEKYWCYGTLWRAYDLMPQTIMTDRFWECPHCMKICSRGACRSDPRQKPYEPKGTLLGHDTKKVADARSVECLVDFGHSNLNWLKESEEMESSRLRKRKQEAEHAKMQDVTLGDRYVSEAPEGPYPPPNGNGIEYDVDDTIDPTLGSGQPSVRHPHAANSMIDPALRGEEDVEDYEMDTTMPSNDNLPLYNGYEDPGYNHSGFVAPSDVYHQHDAEMEDESYLYPEPSNPPQRPPEGGKKRKGGKEDREYIKLLPPKRRKVDKADKPAAPVEKVNTATKQWQQAQERRQLEEAKKAGRYIIAHARMRGRRRLVKLKLPREKLLEFRDKELAAKRDERRRAAAANLDGAVDVDGAEQPVLLQSNINIPNARKADGPPKKKESIFRYRVEDDEDFRTSRRDHKKTSDPTAQGKTSNRKRARYEETDLDDEEDENDMYETTARQQNATTGRRALAWLSRKRAEEDDDLPDELPPDFKDGRRRTRNEEKERRQTMPVAQKRPSIRPARASTGGIAAGSDDSVIDALFEDDDFAASTPAPPLSSDAIHYAREASKVMESASTKAALQLAEENLKAKQQAAKWVGSPNSVIGDGGSSDSEAGSAIFVSPGPKSPPKANEAKLMSLAEKMKAKGKKIKIVGPKGAAATDASPTNGEAKRARGRPPKHGSGGASVKAPGSPAPQVLELSSDASDDSSGDEIPARVGGRIRV
ncbi:hypothetical protein M501DRAFT_970878 [Patellaria atrata CBS 101060]|uniref:JmjC domain-containing protein n=1 Tax=Patellaria atrata CBS 101060 TaxID=1346257 RepID=A0A9P4VUI2_9PEZI|nr:hypothetical protein M501DRAFT_970878 [Patellaria atrata CBS 101060]